MIKLFQKQNKNNPKQGIAALMLVLILGTIALAIAISEFTYNMWSKQNLEWNILKTQGQARAESGVLYTLMQYLYNINTTESDPYIMYLTESDKDKNLGIMSSITTTTDTPPCSPDIQCKKINTTFNTSGFSFNYTQYMIEEARGFGNIGEATRVIPMSLEFQQFRLPLLKLGVWMPFGYDDP